MLANAATYGEARALYLEQKHGVLSTHSMDMPGYPFGSICTYGVDRQGLPLILISDIAQHTKNIEADPKVSLTILDHSKADVQASARLTVLARAVKVEDDKDAAERYYQYFPEARRYHEAHDFSFYRLETERLRYIGGFGKIFWLESEKFFRANPFNAEQEHGIVHHMNEDHVAALQTYLERYKGLNLTRELVPRMAGIDAEGFDVHYADRTYRFTLPEAIATGEEARKALIALLRN